MLPEHCQSRQLTSSGNCHSCRCRRTFRNSGCRVPQGARPLTGGVPFAVLVHVPGVASQREQLPLQAALQTAPRRTTIRSRSLPARSCRRRRRSSFDTRCRDTRRRRRRSSSASCTRRCRCTARCCTPPHALTPKPVQSPPCDCSGCPEVIAVQVARLTPTSHASHLPLHAVSQQ